MIHGVTLLRVQQARALPSEARVAHYYVMNATIQLRLRLSLQRVSRVKLWTTEFLQKGKTRIKMEHTMAAIKKGKVNSVLFLFKFSILYFYAQISP